MKQALSPALVPVPSHPPPFPVCTERERQHRGQADQALWTLPPHFFQSPRVRKRPGSAFVRPFTSSFFNFGALRPGSALFCFFLTSFRQSEIPFSRPLHYLFIFGFFALSSVELLWELPPWAAVSTLIPSLFSPSAKVGRPRIPFPFPLSRRAAF